MTDKLRAAAQAALEAWDTRAGIDTASKAFEALRAALAEPTSPRRDWVGLTDEEELMIGVATGLTGVAIRMIEAALKEKNT